MMDDLLIAAEHDNPETAVVCVFDDHYAHIEAHCNQEDSRLLSHIAEHIKMLQTTDPQLLSISHDDILGRY